MRKQFIFSLVVMLIIASLAGCMPFRRPTPTPTPTNPITPTPQSTVQPTAADRVIKIVNAMPEVKTSYALVVGNVAMVGVDLRDKLTADKENALKTRISADTKRQMPELAEVWVTSDPDLVTRIRNLASRISRGEPITGFFDEITNIAKKLQPKGS
ncbi:MAG TPA: hypothetical protein DDZ53_02255 [Firmicutes bacterium]|jgi:YhcN/YlaJ family sporulation lipoprotein|nr:hypothetical protein [Bacillota bacterium]